MNSSAYDVAERQPHIRTTTASDGLTKQLEDARDNMKRVLVCEMLVTGFCYPPDMQQRTA
ncbi:MAG TPA: hypothetical protein DD670_04770 [Planctomycetaceae bacterium]|nr:hypothetical protein [Planctomycetaceae bacterium]